MAGFRMEQQSGQEMEQQPVVVMTDVLDNITKVPGAWGAEKEHFMTERDSDLLQDDKQQHNSLCIGEPGAGKTALTGDLAVHTYTQLANASSEEMPRMDNLPKMPNGAPLSVIAFGWSDIIKAAVSSGAVVPKEYGEWDDVDLRTFTRAGGRALAVARKGQEGIMGTNGNYTSSAHMDIAMVTAARKRSGDMVGKDRFFTAAERLARDPATSSRLRVAAVVTDSESLLARMTSRADMETIQTAEDLYVWLRAYGMTVDDKEIEWLLRHLPKSFADVKAASLLRAQTNRTILSLQGDTYQLPEAHVHLLQDEIQLLDEGRLLTDPAIIASHDERNKILTGSFYPHIISGLVPEERGLICENPDTAEVNLHPSVMRGSWVAQLHAYNRRLLFTP